METQTSEYLISLVDFICYPKIVSRYFFSPPQSIRKCYSQSSSLLFLVFVLNFYSEKLQELVKVGLEISAVERDIIDC
jgi:hypothetical protein